MKKITALLFCILLASCARELGANTVISTDEAGIVNQGTILSVRSVQIKENDKLEENGMGVLGGAVAGGVAGSTVGKGDGQAIATVGGALAGAALGAILQDQLGQSEGFEYLVKLEGGKNKKYQDYREEKEYALSRDDMKDKLKKTINTPDTESDIISVVQGKDTVLAVGQKVYVIYNTDRIRLVAAN